MSNSTMPERKQRLIGATIGLILKQGYARSTVDQICSEAGVTKGAFFHYFANKERVALAAMQAWSDGWNAIIEHANFPAIEDPIERLMNLFVVMMETYTNESIPMGCVIGTVAQEVAHTDETLRTACEIHFDEWLRVTIKLLDDAKQTATVEFDSEQVGKFMISMVQGSMLVAKTYQDRAILANNVAQMHQFVSTLFKS